MFQNKRILDVGPSIGTYSKLIREYGYKIDCVEIYEPYITKYNLKELYDNVFVGDIINFDISNYDFIILGDVLEHIEEEQGIELIKKLYSKCDELVVAIPFNAPQGEWGGNIYETHLQPNLTHEDFLKKYEGFRPLEYRNDYGVYVKS